MLPQTISVQSIFPSIVVLVCKFKICFHRSYLEFLGFDNMYKNWHGLPSFMEFASLRKGIDLKSEAHLQREM